MTKKTAAVAPAATLIEKWMNVDRVLESMPEHERQHHFNMATWGEKTDCGTVACAAGQCGLDPWFRERGLKLVFKRGETMGEVANVAEFFGFEGTKRIFLNARPRPVETVIGEVRQYVNELQRIEQISARLQLPKIGDEWPEQGGVFAGVRAGVDGARDYLLIVGPQYDGYLKWRAANEWAGTLQVGEFTDFSLPTRVEGAALFDRVRSTFEATWYWLSEQHAGLSGCAWGQYFYDGDQNFWRKDNGHRARAVRRVPIQ